MNVPLRRREILMSGKFLNRSFRRTAYRQMRTERVAEHVRSVIEQLRLLRRPTDAALRVGAQLCVGGIRETPRNLTRPPAKG